MAQPAHFLDREGKTWAEEDFGLDRRLTKATAKLGFIYPTLVQSKCVPLALSGRDLLVRARTGSGKTVAYALPLLHKILRFKDAEPHAEQAVRAVILVPTRELCAQARAHLWELIHYCRDAVSVLALVDDNTSAQQAQLRDRPDILIATPARLVSHLRAGNVALGESVETLVVDEADLVLSFGYVEDVRTIMAAVPSSRQGILLSATLSKELEELKKAVLRRPATLKLEEGAGSGRLVQYYLPLSAEADKPLVLFALLRLGLLGGGKGLFFVNSVDACYRLKLFLEAFHVRSAVLNAELPLNSRLHILQEFNRGIFDYLIATDDSLDVSGGAGGDASDVSDGENEAAEEEASEDDEDDSDDDSVAGSEGVKDEDASADSDEAAESSADEEGSEEEVEGSGSDDGVQSEDEIATKKLIKSSASGPDATKASRKKSAAAAAAPAAQGQSKKKRKRSGKDAEYGVSRGVDFKGVSIVVNVDIPPTSHSYTHRVGRTARGGASGTALTLVLPSLAGQADALMAIQESQPPLPESGGAAHMPLQAVPAVTDASLNAAGSSLQAQPVRLPFDIGEVEQFRYRVTDVYKGITGVMVREARAAELKAELVNSEKLRDHFRDNPDDLRVLRHDKTVLHPLRKQEHLRHIPSYLMPAGLEMGEDAALRQRRKRRRGGEKRRLGNAQDGGRRKDNDPLQSFAAPSAEAGPSGGDSGAGKGAKSAPQGLMQHSEFRKQKSTSGRRKWQERHKKGKSSKGFKDRQKNNKKGTRFDIPL